ncbi:MAG TPA: efflux RND transporter permease subunit, partial [Gemmataceae bacterium]
TLISAFNSLTLSPALAAILLQPRDARKDRFGRLLDLLFGWFFRAFNWSFRRTTGVYTRLVGLALRGSVVVLVLYGGLMLLAWWDFTHLPTGYIPNQDQRRLYAAVQLPDSASLERTQEVIDRIARIAEGDAKRGGTYGGPSPEPNDYDLTGAALKSLKDAQAPTDLLTDLEPFSNQRLAKHDLEEFLKKDVADEDDRTKFLELLEDYARPRTYPGIPGVAHTISVAGQSFVLSANGSNFGNLFITLEAFDDPNGSKRTYDEIAADLQKQVDEEIPEAIVKVLGPPPVSGLGSTGGFKFIVEDRSGDNDLKKLQEETDNFIATGNEARYILTDALLEALQDAEVEPDVRAAFADVLADLSAHRNREFGPRDLTTIIKKHIPRDEEVKKEKKKEADRQSMKELMLNHANKQPQFVAGLFTVFRANTPQLYVDLNREQCQTMGVNPGDVFTTLQVYLGSFYVNDFNLFGRTWQVVVQGAAPFRNDAEKVKRLKVRNAAGNMVPLGAVLTVSDKPGPILLMRYNMYPAAAVVGGTAKGVSSGEGIEAMQRLARQTLAKGMSYEWTEINYIQVDAAKNIWNNLIFPLAVVFVFLVLAAQYESWALPLAVILVVPMCILGSLTGVQVTHSDINIFTQIGFVVLVGLASKNAILIVEFAKHRREAGMSRRDATLEACKLRLRPILMTSFAFILGVVPLMLATGAGAEMRRTLGTAVFSGMLGVTLFGIFLTPVFFYVIEWFMDTHLFAPARMKRVGRRTLYVVGMVPLGLRRLMSSLLGKFSRRPVPTENAAPAKQTTATTNGEGALADREAQHRIRK